MTESPKEEFLGSTTIKEEDGTDDSSETELVVGHEKWLGDSGASCHVTMYSHLLYNTTTDNLTNVIVGDKRKCSVKARGDLDLVPEGHDQCIELKDVRVVEAIGKNIISLGKLLTDGGTMSGGANSLTIFYNGFEIIFGRSEKDGLYYLKATRVNNQPTCYQVTDENNSNWELVGEGNQRRANKIGQL